MCPTTGQWCQANQQIFERMNRKESRCWDDADLHLMLWWDLKRAVSTWIPTNVSKQGWDNPSPQRCENQIMSHIMSWWTPPPVCLHVCTSVIRTWSLCQAQVRKRYRVSALCPLWCSPLLTLLVTSDLLFSTSGSGRGLRLYFVKRLIWQNIATDVHIGIGARWVRELHLVLNK